MRDDQESKSHISGRGQRRKVAKEAHHRLQPTIHVIACEKRGSESIWCSIAGKLEPAFFCGGVFPPCSKYRAKSAYAWSTFWRLILICLSLLVGQHNERENTECRMNVFSRLSKHAAGKELLCVSLNLSRRLRVKSFMAYCTVRDTTEASLA